MGVVDGCTIGEIAEAHWPTLCAVYNHYARHSTATFHSHPLSVAAFRELLTFPSPRHRAFVALEGEPCGYGVIAPYKNREAYADTAEVSVYVRSDCLRRGIGGALVDHLERHARGQGVHALIATITAENNPSIALFEGKGYVKCAHLREVGFKFGRRLDVVCYEKLLPA